MGKPKANPSKSTANMVAFFSTWPFDLNFFSLESLDSRGAMKGSRAPWHAGPYSKGEKGEEQSSHWRDKGKSNAEKGAHEKGEQSSHWRDKGKSNAEKGAHEKGEQSSHWRDKGKSNAEKGAHESEQSTIGVKGRTLTKSKGEKAEGKGKGKSNAEKGAHEKGAQRSHWRDEGKSNAEKGAEQSTIGGKGKSNAEKGAEQSTIGGKGKSNAEKGAHEKGAQRSHWRDKGKSNAEKGAEQSTIGVKGRSKGEKGVKGKSIIIRNELIEIDGQGAAAAAAEAAFEWNTSFRDSRPDFSKYGERGVVLGRIWDLAEEEERDWEEFDAIDVPTKNAVQFVRKALCRCQARGEEIPRLEGQLRKLEETHEAQQASSGSSSNSAATTSSGAATASSAATSSSAYDFLPGEFLRLLR